MVDVDTARRKLLEALGEYAEKYWSNMKLWYKQKISKDGFDSQAFELLGPGKINYHNEFILSILAKCQAVASSAPVSSHAKSATRTTTKSVHLKKPRVKRCSESEGVSVQEFLSADPMKTAPPFISKGEDQDVTLCSQDLVLPDVSTLHGRLFLGAWDAGLDSIADETAPLLVAAVEAHLKNIIMASVSRRKSFCIREGSHFRYRFGAAHMKTDLFNENLYNESLPKKHKTCDQAEANAYSRLASGEMKNLVQQPISLFDLRDAVQENPNIISSHTVRAGNMERILAEAWHPSHEEIEQNELYILETRKLHEKLKQQRGLRI